MVNKSKEKNRTKSKRKAGVKDKKPSIRQLSKFGLSRDETDKILRELAALEIQGKAKSKIMSKYINIINELINRSFQEGQLEHYYIVLQYFVDSINTTYDFDPKKTPGYLLRRKPFAEDALRQINMILGIKQNPVALKELIEEVGGRKLAMVIVGSIKNIRQTIESIQDYKLLALDDYRGAQLGIETQPDVRNTTTRRVDSIVRPPRTIRAQLSPRRTRSI